MVKSFKYIIKRIIIGTGIAIALMLIKGNLLIGVNAQTIELGTPQTSGNYSGGNWPLTNAPINQSGYYSSYNIAQHPTTGGVYFEWANANLCSGQNMTFSGTAQVYRNGVANLGITSINGYFTGWGNQKSCTFSQNGNSIDFSCTGPGGGSFILYYNYDNVVASNGSTLTINTPINVNITCEASNNDVIQNNTQNTNNIINNNNQNTQDIINNQNDNTEQQIESQKVCITTQIDKTSILSLGYINSSGTVNSNSSNYGVTDYINITDSTINVLLPTDWTSNSYLAFYNQNKLLLSVVNQDSLSLNESISIPTGAYYVRFSINSTRNKPQFELITCKNGNQAISDGQQQLNDTLNDDTGVSDNDIEELFGDFEESNTPISDLLLMPITLYSAFITGISASCSPVSLGSLYDTPITLPCINLEDILGSSLWSLIDLLFSFFMFYNISQLIISAFNNLTSLKDDFNLLFAKHYNQEYQGRHAG